MSTWMGWVARLGEAANAFLAALDGAGVPVAATDQLLEIAGAGQKTAGASAAVTTGVSGGGYLTITNTDTSVAAYLGTGTVDATKFKLAAGLSITMPIADVTTVNCFSSGTPVLSWIFLQAP